MKIVNFENVDALKLENARLRRELVHAENALESIARIAKKRNGNLPCKAEEMAPREREIYEHAAFYLASCLTVSWIYDCWNLQREAKDV